MKKPFIISFTLFNRLITFQITPIVETSATAERDKDASKRDQDDSCTGK